MTQGLLEVPGLEHPEGLAEVCGLSAPDQLRQRRSQDHPIEPPPQRTGFRGHGGARCCTHHDPTGERGMLRGAEHGTEPPTHTTEPSGVRVAAFATPSRALGGQRVEHCLTLGSDARHRGAKDRAGVIDDHVGRMQRGPGRNRRCTEARDVDLDPALEIEPLREVDGATCGQRRELDLRVSDAHQRRRGQSQRGEFCGPQRQRDHRTVLGDQRCGLALLGVDPPGPREHDHVRVVELEHRRTAAMRENAAAQLGLVEPRGLEAQPTGLHVTAVDEHAR